MRKLTVLIDMDDTIEHLLPSWIKFLNKQFNRSVRVQDVIDWDIDLFYPGVGHEQIRAPLSMPELWETVRPMSGAAKYMRKMIKDGHDIYIVTSSYYNTIKYKTEKVLIKYFPFIDWDHVIIAHNKQLIKGDVLIDDGVHNLENGEYKKILMSAPHNKGYDAESNGMKRVSSWAEVYEAVTSLANENE